MFSRRLSLALALLLAPSFGAQADVIRLVPGATIKAAGGQINGQITAESPAEVSIKPNVGAEQKVPVDQIDDVIYDNLTPSFSLAESRENAGALTEAAELYQKAAGEAAGKPLIERAALFGRASILTDLALADPSRVDDALSALESFVKAHPSSRQLGPALEDIIRLSLQKGDTTRAESALNDLRAKVPSAAGRSAVLEARVLSRKGQYDQALAKLDAIIGQAPKDSAQVRQAMLAKAESLVGMKKFDDAEKTVREVIKQAPPEAADIQAEAHNTLGDCLRAANRPKDALIAYLKTDILYDSDKEQHPRALARIAQLWTDLKQSERAAEVQERLRQLYPQSPYAPATPVAPR